MKTIVVWGFQVSVLFILVVSLLIFIYTTGRWLLSFRIKRWEVVRHWEGSASKLKATSVSRHRTKRSAKRRANHLTAGMSHAGFWYEVHETEKGEESIYDDDQ